MSNINLSEEGSMAYQLLPRNFCVYSNNNILYEKYSEHELDFALDTLVERKYSNTIFSWSIKAQVGIHPDTFNEYYSSETFYWDFNRLLIESCDKKRLFDFCKSKNIIERLPNIAKVEFPLYSKPFNIFSSGQIGRIENRVIHFTDSSSFSGNDNEVEPVVITKFFSNFENVVVCISSFKKYLSCFLNSGFHRDIDLNLFGGIVTPYFLLNDEEFNWIISNAWHDEFLEWAYEGE